MRRIALVVAIVALILGEHARAQSGYQLLQQALSKEQAHGDLKGAIGIYQRIAKEFAGDHALAAQALLRLGDCYQKLGDVQARQVFQRIVREYADQSSIVATARERLGADDTPPRARGDRPVWSGGSVDGFGTVSPDGRYLTYTDWADNSRLMLHDLVTGTNRRLTGGTIKDGATQYSVISHDGRQVAYEWRNAADRYELRVMDLQSSGTPVPRRIVDIEESQEIAPFDWSPDNRWIAVHITRKDHTGQIALVHVADGSTRVLKSVHWKGPLRIAFSPDGRYIAYDIMVDAHPLERQIYVMSVDGSREARVVDDHSGNAVMGWSPDGRDLLVSSDRSGSIDLWAIRIVDGRPAGGAFVVKPNIGTFWSNGVSASGTMYVWKNASPIYLQVASIDLTAGRLAAPPSEGDRTFIVSRGHPAWSWDGRQLAWISCSPLGGGPCRLLVRSMDTGRTRQIDTPLRYLFFPRFSPNSRWLVTLANDDKGRHGIYRIDVVTGETVLITRDGTNPQPMADGSTLVYERRTGDTVTFVERDLAGGEPRRLLQAPQGSGGAVSPDGQSIAILTKNVTTGETTLSVMPLSGGTERTLLRVSSPAQLWGADPRHVEWTPDSRSVLVVKALSADSDLKELWQVPIDGREARRLNIDINRWLAPDGGFRLSPDGKRIVFVEATGRTGQEIWALENFLPASRSARR